MHLLYTKLIYIHIHICIYNLLTFVFTSLKELPLSANETVPEFSTVAFRAVFDLSFFIIVTLLGFNIVIAIMVDQFQHLRQRKVCLIKFFFVVTFEVTSFDIEMHHILFTARN